MGDFVLGEEVEKFEAWMSGRCHRAHSISLNSGTDALLLALRALEIGPGDEVITRANTFVATVGAIVSAGLSDGHERGIYPWAFLAGLGR